MLGIVLGGALSVWAEYDETRAMCERAGVKHMAFAVNDMIPAFPGLCHAVTLHPETKLPAWLEARETKGHPRPVEVWSKRRDGLKLVTRTCRNWLGSSGMFAIDAALAWDCSAVVLCGVPMAEWGGHFLRGTAWSEVNDFWPAWIVRRAELAPAVRSCSGRTAELFGLPTDDFIRGL
jgi:hypothetical protein